MQKFLSLLQPRVVGPINIREYGLSKVCAAWHDPDDEMFYDSDFIFNALSMLQKWFDPIAAAAPDGWKAKLLVSLVGTVCSEDMYSDAYATVSAYVLPEEPIVLGSPEGPLDDSILCLYENGDRKWVGVLKFGEEGAEAIYVFNVEHQL